MSPRQRILAALRRQPTDRLPVAARNLHPFPWGSHHKYPEYQPLFDAIARTGAAMLCAVGLAKNKSLRFQTTTSTDPDGTQITTDTLPTPLGDLRRLRRQPPGQPAMTTEHFIKDDRDLARFQSIEPDPIDWGFSRLTRCDEIGDAGLAMISYDDPFYIVSQLFDQEEFIIRIHSDPAPILELIEQTCQRVERDLSRLLQGLDSPRRDVLFLCIGAELATPPLMSPRIIPQVVTPFETRIVNLIHRHGQLACVHCHGHIRAALPEFIRCRFDATEPCEPPPQGDISLAELKESAADQIALMGYVQDQELHYATPDHIRSHVRAIASLMTGFPGYIAATTCTPFQNPPTPTWVQNYLTFLESAAEIA